MYNLSIEQLNELIAFASDDRKPASTEAIEALNNLHNAVQKNVLRHLEGARKRNAMLNEKVHKITERKQEAYSAGDFKESGRDSVEVAQALLYQLQQLKTYKLNKYKVNAILYEMYASWLESKKERLFIEHPVATEFGPRFWRVFRHVDTGVSVPYSVWSAFAQNNPDVAAFCRNAAAKYYDYAEGELSRMFMASKAYKNATADKNNGKWNKEMQDTEIYAWKAQQKQSKQ